jgi:2-oxoisovalerate dehydrogenase E2 component (dihydrolipoyl transacylase)
MPAEIKDFKLPDVGEGLTEADILKWAVQPGDTVVVNQVLVEVETAKAAVELPSPFAGVVVAVRAKEGETVQVGTPIISIDTGVSDVPTQPPPDSSERQSVLVGYGPRSGSAGRRARKRPAASDAPSANPAFNVTTETDGPGDGAGSAAPPPLPATSAAASRVAEPAQVLAKPPVRKLAKTLGVDLGAVPATGPNGTVSRADVEQAATLANAPTAARPPAARSDAERETRVPIKGVRKHTAAAMVASAFTAPHVTEFVAVDLTPTMELRDRVAARREFRDLKVSPLLFVAKAVILAARRTPQINATWDEADGVMILKHYVNLGIAAATERGLLVPNIKDADRLSLLELAQAINMLTETARAGRTAPADMTGGTLTITNVGVFGVDTGTPILNPGEAGIVAFGAVRRMPWVVRAVDGTEQLVPRWVTQLAVSFDHRLVDGQQGSQFLADVAALLADPGLALL